MSNTEELIRAKLSGVVLHRQKVLTPFGQADQSPLTDVLFSITRPPAEKKKRRIEPTAMAPPTPEERIPLPKGMVNYRRERYGE